MNNNRYYLLTGAAGFLGTNICMQLLEAGCKVRALVLPNDKSVKFIPEPIADGPVADDKTALVLMPGLAFDPQGHRCGYGGGFYDKFLAEEPDHPTLALCYEFQMLPHLETEEHDIPVDYVIWA